MAEKNLTLNFWPVGTGPFMQTEYIENRRHVIERNPNFRGETYPCEGEPGDKEKGYLDDCGKMIPFVDKVVFDLEKEGVPLQAKFLQGYYDSPAIERLDYGTAMIVAMSDDKKKDKEYREKGIKLPTTIEANNWYIGFNWLDPVVGKGDTPAQAERNRKLRQALSIAIDWEEHIAIFERGQGVAAQGPLPPSLFGYREDGPSAFNPVVYNRGPDGKPVRRSIDEAKKLLAEAGYPDGRDAKTGKPLVLNFDYQSAPTPGVKALLDWYTKQFAKIGVQLEVRATDYNRFQDKMTKGSIQIFFWGWLADYPDAENFLFMLYGPNSKALTDGNGENNTNYQNPEFDKLFEQMKFLEDGPEKQKLIDRMIEIVQKDAVWSFGYFPTSAAAYHQWISNGKPTQIVRNHIGYLRLDPELRARKIAEWNQPVWWPIPLLALGLRRSPSCRPGSPGAAASARPPRARWRPRAPRRDQLHPPPDRLRRADPDRRQPVHLPAVLHREHAGRHGADEHRRQARDAGRDREMEGGARLRQAALLERQGGGDAEAHEHDLRRALGAALRVRLRRVRQRARHRLRAEAARGAVDRAGDPDVHSRHLRRDRVLAAARVLPQHLPRVLGRHAGRVPAVDLVAVLHHRRPVLLQQAPEAGADLRFRGRRRSLRLSRAADRSIGIASRLGGEALFYRTMFLEEIGKDYVRTARSKGLSETVVLFRHVLRNAMLPILTSTVAVLPLLFLGALIMESFFGIPGLGSYTIDAINAQDFAVVRSMVFVGSVLYIVGLILTDISYTVADPRIRLA